MEIRAFRQLWGLEGEPLARLLPEIAAQGYIGVEAALADVEDSDRLRREVAANGLTLKPLLELAGSTPGAQIAEYRGLLAAAGALEPDGVTVHSGRDRWSREESVAFYREAVALESELGVEVGHETHRGRSLFAPWSTAPILAAVPGLRLVGDLSHWVVVCERLLEDQGEALRLAATRTVHLHARVGFEQGPQVADPRSPEAAAALAAHEAWWELVWESQRAAGAAATTFTPEYGPPPYLPHGSTPAELREVVEWQTRRTRERFLLWRREHDRAAV